MINAPDIWFSARAGATVRPATWAAYMCVATILPLFMLSSMSATTPAWELANPPSAMPRPVRTVPVCLTEFAAGGLQVADLGGLDEHVLPLIEPVVDLGGGDVLEPEQVGVHVGQVGQMVDQLFGREAGLRGVRRPQRRGLEVVV